MNELLLITVLNFTCFSWNYIIMGENTNSPYRQLLVWLYMLFITTVIVIITSLTNLKFDISGHPLFHSRNIQEIHFCAENFAENKVFLSRLLEAAKRPRNQDRLQKQQREFLGMRASSLIEVTGLKSF